MPVDGSVPTPRRGLSRGVETPLHSWTRQDDVLAMAPSGARRRSMIEDKTPRLRAVLAMAGAVLGLGSGLPAASAAATPVSANADADAKAPGVARPNLRLGVQYDYFHIDPTEASNEGTTLRVPNLDGQAGRTDVVGTFPILGPIGGRVIGRARYGDTQRSLDGLERGNNEVVSYGVGGELFVRDSNVGSFSAGAGFDRLDGQGSLGADQWSGTANASIFFPDLGNGAVDWVFRFGFAHREVFGAPGSVDFDSDRYSVSGSAGWYVSENLQLVLGGRWERAEEEFSSEDDREGFAQVRWLTRVLIPVELNVGGFGGISDFKQSPFRSDHRTIYGVNAGVVLRFGSGATLIESVRQFD